MVRLKGVRQLNYSGTNTYLIEGDGGRLLFDTGWAGTFHDFCSAVGELDIPVQGIDYILISHFHPDHMGIAQQIADMGPVIVVADVQKDRIHDSDCIFEKESGSGFKPIDDTSVIFIDIAGSRDFLARIGISGQIMHTPGHSDDSISLCLDNGELFVGDLNPLYELELHTNTQIADSWEKLLDLKPKVIYYGHAKPAYPDDDKPDVTDKKDGYRLVSKIIRYIDRDVSLEKISKKTGADRSFIEDVARMYLTHRNIGVQGILDRIELKRGSIYGKD